MTDRPAPLTAATTDLRDWTKDLALYMDPKAMPNAKAKRLRAQRMSDARAIGTHTQTEWEALVISCGGRCVRCGTDRYNVECDHILPVSMGGSDAIENLQPLCARCNCSKGPESIDHRPAGALERALRAVAAMRAIAAGIAVDASGRPLKDAPR